MITFSPVGRRAVLPVLTLALATGALLLGNACSSSRSDSESEESAEALPEGGEVPVAGTDPAPPEVPSDAQPGTATDATAPVATGDTSSTGDGSEPPKKKARRRAWSGRTAAASDATGSAAAVGSTQDAAQNSAPQSPPQDPPPQATNEMAQPTSAPVASASSADTSASSSQSEGEDTVSSGGGMAKLMEKLLAYRMAVAAGLATLIAGGGAMVFRKRRI